MPTFKIAATFTIEADEKPEATDTNKLFQLLSSADDEDEIEWEVDEVEETEDAEAEGTEVSPEDTTPPDPIENPLSVNQLADSAGEQEA